MFGSVGQPMTSRGKNGAGNAISYNDITFPEPKQREAAAASGEEDTAGERSSRRRRTSSIPRVLLRSFSSSRPHEVSGEHPQGKWVGGDSVWFGVFRRSSTPTPRLVVFLEESVAKPRTLRFVLFGLCAFSDSKCVSLLRGSSTRLCAKGGTTPADGAQGFGVCTGP
ncbi:unnamed protein product [Pleuronectes platessa]|uniref:Uncharacterized protein n=1 Tax=Pleuronectes platessa TaxID=8262 RepID=A0A9N7VNP2_PLEPL|nr:unnamed protein product [Pleuronectes platessa]